MIVEDILAFIKAKYEKHHSINQSFVVGINGIDCSENTTYQLECLMIEQDSAS